MNTYQTKKINRMAFSILAILFISLSTANAQRVKSHMSGGKTGTNLDMYVINKDMSNYDCGLRIQSNDNGYFLWQRYEDNKFRISSGGDGHNGAIENDLFELDWEGNMGFRGKIFDMTDGTVDINDAVKVYGDFSLSGTISDYNSDVKIADGLIVTGSIYNDGGNVTINDHLNMMGDIYDSDSDLKINDGLIVTGNVYDDGGDFTINDNLNLTGKIYDSNSEVLVDDAMIINQTLQTKGISTFNDKLTVTAQGINVTGASTFNDNVTVAGNIVADAVTLNVGSFPDYVFEEDYNLLSLSEIEAHINQYKRLPNMPSEQEVLANGMNAGQINVLLVEKVEELTLHTIEQEKEIKALKSTLEAIMKKLEEK